MKRTIWLFGDSFTTESYYPKYLRKLIGGLDKHDEINQEWGIKNYSGGSMDMQTILDFWIKSLPEIKSSDVVIVNLTDSTRTRLALNENSIYYLPHSPKDKKSYFDYINNSWLVRMGGVAKTDISNFLSDSILNKFIDFIQIEKLNKAYSKNYLEIVESLYKITPTDLKMIWSWNDEYIADFIYDNQKLKNEILDGIWETQNDEYIKTNGESGMKCDYHLSTYCNKKLANYIYNKFIKENDKKSLL